MYSNREDLFFYEMLVHGMSPARTHTAAFFDAVLSIQNSEQAVKFFRGCVQFFLRKNPHLGVARIEQIVRSDIGYCFGEGMPPAMRKMWHSTTGAVHPYFGTSDPDPLTAFVLGLKLGETIQLINEVLDELSQQMLKDLEKN